MYLQLLLVLTGLFTSAASHRPTPDRVYLPDSNSSAASASETLDPYSHSNFSSLFPDPPKPRDVQLQSTEYESNTTSTIQPENPSATMNGTLSSICPALYVHNGSAASMIAAIGRAVSDGVGVITVGVFCPKIQEDLPLAAAVRQARREGTALLCQGGPTPQFIQVVAGGPPITISIPFSNAGGHSVGAAFDSEVQVFSADLSLYVSPTVVSFESPGQENKNVTITVLAHTGGGSGEGRARCYEAHVQWTSRGDGGRVIVGHWLFVVSVLQSG